MDAGTVSYAANIAQIVGAVPIIIAGGIFGFRFAARAYRFAKRIDIQIKLRPPAR